ncbi:putative myc box-dependent-interacting protein 1 isoform X2 [Penaeus vannamei]|uniref:Putative myc box-dependent-interacting protein 1 isoform X2 n=1 Tax=Penaeus vannamei TaxID=6689 RepID=A0A3R7M5V7_PENVA|nr:putative myc box-dependent-interacting protein 1 isoform X2 [Penaeus vannamei]
MAETHSEQIYDIPVGATTDNLPPGVLYRVRATYKYTREDVDEISFEVGDVIQVVEYDDPEEQFWGIGVIGVLLGYFRGNWGPFGGSRAKTWTRSASKWVTSSRWWSTTTLKSRGNWGFWGVIGVLLGVTREDMDEISFEVGDVIQVVEYDDPEEQVSRRQLGSHIWPL